MPPVVAAVAAAGASAAAAATSAGLAAGAAVGLSAGTSFAVMGAFQQLATGVILSAVGRALMPKPGTGGSRGTKLRLDFGEQAPQSIILGMYTTAGDLVYAGSWGEPGGTHNAYYVQVVELSDWPARLSRCFINGEWVELGTTPRPDGLGYPVQGYQRKGKDFLWVKFYDGTQTVADPYLIDKFGDDDDYPWTDEMIGRGIPYAIVTAKLQPKLNAGKPECRFEISAWGHYDRRKDSTAGGSGAQRANDWTTWAPSLNPIVLVYNVLMGLRDPITDDFVWGGQAISVRDLPASVWFAAMNECDALVATPVGTETAYRAGLEVRLDEEPASIIEELLKACAGLIAEQAGEWHVRAGPQPVPVYGFSDDDVIVTQSETFEPFPGIDDAYNEVHAVYPEPGEGWNTKDAPARANADYLSADGGKRNVAEVEFPAVFRFRQIQRLMASMLKDGRRFRRHTLVLPPEAQALGPLDAVSRSSERYGYASKVFDIGMTEDLRDGCVAVALHERDPTDYDWSSDDELPTVVGYPRRPVREVEYADFSVEGATIIDAGGGARRPAIRLNWTVREGVTAIYYRVRLVDEPDHIPGNTAAAPPPGGSSTETLTLGGEPVELGGEPVTYTVFDDETAGTLLIHPVLPATDYEVQAIYAPTVGREWSAWLPVTTPDVRIGEDDLTDLIVGKITEARTAATDAALDAAAALAKADEIEDLLGALGEEVLEDLAELADALAGGDFATLEARVGAGLQRGWVHDPTFAHWTGSNLDKWTGAGITSYGVQSPAGRFPTSLLIDVPSGSAAVDVTASSEVAGQMDGADFAALYVVATLHLCALAGSLGGAFCRVEWKVSGSWVRGDAFGQAASLGRLSEDWGFVVDDDRIQEKAVVVKAPAGATAIRLVFAAKQASPTSAVEVRVDYLDVRAASEAEVRGYLANGYAAALITAYDLTITGPGGAIAAAVAALTAAYGAADAAVTSTVVALATDVGALAGKVELVSAQFGGNNLVRNGAFSDGARAGGVAPNFWSSWDAEASVIQRGSTADPPVVNAPTRYVARIAGDTVVRDFLAIDPPVPVVPGQRLATGIQVAAIGTAPSFPLGVRLRFYDATGTLMSNRVVNHPVTVNGSTWLTGAWTDVVPAGAATFDLLVRRAAGGSAHVGLFTNVEARLVDGVAYAAAETATAAAADATSAIATMQAQVAASFGNFGAFVQTVATAAATTDLAASMYVIRATAGAGSAGMRIVAFDDETGSGGSITLYGDQVIVPGTLSTSALVIADLGVNKVPDDQIQSSRAWSGTGFEVRPTASNANAESIGEFRWIAGGALPATGASVPFQVRPGSRLNCSYMVQRLGGTTMNCRAQIQWLDREGLSLGSTPIGADVTGSATANLLRQAMFTVPAAARKARLLFLVLAGTDGAVRFTAPQVIPNMDASALITPDGAFFEQLSAQTAWIYDANIVNAAVSTLKIGSNAVTIPLFVQKNTAGPTATTSFTDILDFNMTLDFPGTLTVTAAVNFEGVDGSFGFTSYRSDWQLIIDGTVVFDTDLFRSPAMDDANDVITMVGAKFCAAGTRRVRVQFRKPPSEPAGRLFPRNRRASAIALVAKR